MVALGGGGHGPTWLPAAAPGGLRTSKAAARGSLAPWAAKQDIAAPPGLAGLPDPAPPGEEAAGHGRPPGSNGEGLATTEGHFPGPHVGAAESTEPSSGREDDRLHTPHAWSGSCLVPGAVAPRWTTPEQQPQTQQSSRAPSFHTTGQASARPPGEQPGESALRILPEQA